MAVKVEENYKKSIKSARPLADTFSYCVDYQKSIGGNFPSLESFKPVGPSVYQWTFEKFGHGGHNLEIALTTRFTEEALKKITLSPAPGTNTGEATGEWIFTPQGEQTEVGFHIRLTLDLPIPFFLKSVAAPLAQKGLTEIFDRYLSNVEKALRQ